MALQRAWNYLFEQGVVEHKVYVPENISFECERLVLEIRYEEMVDYSKREPTRVFLRTHEDGYKIFSDYALINEDLDCLELHEGEEYIDMTLEQAWYVFGLQNEIID